MSDRKSAHGMTLRYPAIRWQDALPTGSGVVGALVYGNIQNDTILLNHDALYSPNTPTPVVDVSDQVPEVRRLIQEGQCREAAQLMAKAFTERTQQEVGSTSTAPGDINLSALQQALGAEPTMSFVGRHPNGFSFGALGKLDAQGGTIRVVEEALVVEGVDEVVVRVRLFLGEPPTVADTPVSFHPCRKENGYRRACRRAGLDRIREHQIPARGANGIFTKAVSDEQG